MCARLTVRCRVSLALFPGAGSWSGCVRIGLRGGKGRVALRPVVHPSAHPARVAAVEAGHLRSARGAHRRRDLRGRRLGGGRLALRFPSTGHRRDNLPARAEATPSTIRTPASRPSRSPAATRARRTAGNSPAFLHPGHAAGSPRLRHHPAPCRAGAEGAHGPRCGAIGPAAPSARRAAALAAVPATRTGGRSGRNGPPRPGRRPEARGARAPDRRARTARSGGHRAGTGVGCWTDDAFGPGSAPPGP